MPSQETPKPTEPPKSFEEIWEENKRKREQEYKNFREIKYLLNIRDIYRIYCCNSVIKISMSVMYRYSSCVDKYTHNPE